MAGSSAGSVAVDLVLNDRAFNNSVRNNIRSTESAYKASFNKIAGFIATAFAVDKVVDFGKEVVKAAADSQAAWTGLNSIVQGTGNNFAVAQKFLTEYTKDGLIGIEDAATAYKNLLSRGYDTSQIEGVMTALKDSAAFGRQSSYELSEAVVSATEGLKNENSILVDNAGVTKNVAKMWDEYAASIGTTRNALTQQQKIQAEVNGILQETRFQAGDAATYTTTFAGRVQILKGAFSSMQIAIGKVVAPIVGLFIPAITNAINAVTAFFTRLQGVLSVFGLEFPDVVQKTTNSVGGATAAIGGMGSSAADTASKIADTGTAAKKAAKEAKRAFASVDEINVINTKTPSVSSGSGGVGGSSGGVGAGTAVNTGNDAVSAAIGSSAEKIKKFVEPLQKISFDKLIKAFNLLKESIKGLGGTIWKGLEWAYFNLLVPLAQWTIEDALPAFFYALSGALDAVNGILQEVYPIIDWLWQNFLKPIASWTGGVIVSVLYGLGDALKWVGDNADIVVSAMGGLAAGWATFKALGILGSIVQFVKYAGNLAGVTGIVKSLGAAISQLWTYFKAGSLVKTLTTAFAGFKAALVAVSAALGISIGWVVAIIAAIAALVAGIIYLVKNWDKVKEVALNVWGKIKEIWGNVASWFNTTVITPVKNFFSGMWTNITNGVANAKTKIVNTFDSIKNGISDKLTAAKNTVSNMINKIKGFFKFEWSLPKIKTPHISWTTKPASGWIAKTLDALGLPTSLPKMNVNWYAQGGWLKKNNPQLAVVGDNKRENEIIAPESKIREQVKQAISEMGAVGQKFVMDLNLKIQTDDGRTLIKKINDVQIQDGYISLMV